MRIDRIISKFSELENRTDAEHIPQRIAIRVDIHRRYDSVL